MTEKPTRPTHSWTRRAAPDGKPSAPPIRFATAPSTKPEWQQNSIFDGLKPDEVEKVFKPAELMMIRIMVGKNSKPSISGIAVDLHTTTGFVLQLVENVERKAKALSTVAPEGRAALIQSFADEPEVMIPIATMDGRAIFERMAIAAARADAPAPPPAAPNRAKKTETRLAIGKTKFKTLADLGDMSRDNRKRFEGRPELLQLIDTVGSLKRKEATPSNLAKQLGKSEEEVNGLFDEIKAAFLKRAERPPEGQAVSSVPASLPQTLQKSVTHEPVQTVKTVVAASSHADTGGVDPDWEKKIPLSLPPKVSLEDSVDNALLHLQDYMAATPGRKEEPLEHYHASLTNVDSGKSVTAPPVQSPAPEPKAKPAKAAAKIHIRYEDLASIKGKYLPMLGLTDDENAMITKASDMPASYVSKQALADEMDKDPNEIALLKRAFEEKVSLFLRSNPDVKMRMIFPNYTSSREAYPGVLVPSSGAAVGNGVMDSRSAEIELMDIYLSGRRQTSAPSKLGETATSSTSGLSAEEELMQMYLKGEPASTPGFSAVAGAASSKPATFVPADKPSVPAIAEASQPAIVAEPITAPELHAAPPPVLPPPVIESAHVPEPPAREPAPAPYLLEENHSPAVRKLLDERREVHVELLAKLPAYVLRNEQLQGEQRQLIEQIFAMRDAGEELTVAALVAKSTHSARDTEKLIDQTAEKYMPLAKQLAPVEQARLEAQRAPKTATSPAASGKGNLFGDLTEHEISLAFRPDEQRVIRYAVAKQGGELSFSKLSTEMEIPEHVMQRTVGEILHKLEAINAAKNSNQRKRVIDGFARAKIRPGGFTVTGPYSSHYLPSGRDTSDKGR